MKLHEITSSQFLTTKNEIGDWLDLMNIHNYTILDDGTVNVDGEVDIQKRNLTVIPIKFGIVGGDFDCTMNDLSSFAGLPTKIEGSLYAQRNKFKSLVGINEHVKSIDGSFYFDGAKIKSGGLGLLLIEGNLIDFSDFGKNRNDKLLLPSFYINKYLGQGEDGLIECQSELIEAGYEEYAQL